jgi:hypothetical protein
MEVCAGQPVLYIDSAKTSTLEGAASTVYATGGKGNSRLIAWEGERTLTFTVEDALLSEVGFAILSGAGLMEAGKKTVYVHTTATQVVEKNGTKCYVNLDDAFLSDSEQISAQSPVFIMTMKHGSMQSMITGASVVTSAVSGTNIKANRALEVPASYNGETVFVDFYVERASGVTTLEIDAENFAGYYYVEASTLFRRQADGKDLPAELIFPNVKIQSNFTFNMAATGDPSTFTFTMDAMPGYTRFDRSKRVLCVMQIVDDAVDKDTGKTDSVTNDADDDLTYPVPVTATVEYIKPDETLFKKVRIPAGATYTLINTSEVNWSDPTYGVWKDESG